MKERWILIMQGTHGTAYGKNEFKNLERFCKQILEDGMERFFEIKYYQNDKLIETVDIKDYFNS